MKFSRLKLHGFKSFSDETVLHMEPGLTGIVGPNGCGKSNLVEAMRWVMGESSYKAMRASGMDDVIFSGSGGRPARN
jgi:chromosome segregation protein